MHRLSLTPISRQNANVAITHRVVMDGFVPVMTSLVMPQKKTAGLAPRRLVFGDSRQI